MTKKKILRKKKFADPGFQRLMFEKMNNETFAEMEVYTRKTIIWLMWDVWLEAKRHKNCMVCNQPFEYTNSRQKYCTDFCAGKSVRSREKQREQMREEIRAELKKEIRDDLLINSKEKSKISREKMAGVSKVADKKDNEKMQQNMEFLEEYLPDARIKEVGKDA